MGSRDDAGREVGYPVPSMIPEAPWSWIGEGPVVYLAPHSDDAAFSSAGLLRACGERGIAVEIVTCFSRSAHSRTEPGGGVERVSEARRAEDRAFAGSLPGPVTLRWLDLDDAPLRPAHAGKHPCKETTMTAADRALAAHVEAIVEGTVRREARIAAPLGLGRHIDHLIVRDAGAALARGGWNVEFWEDLPYAGRLGEDALMREIEQAMEAIGLRLAPFLVTCEDIEAHKARALACYPSQVVDVHRRGVMTHLGRAAAGGGPAERVWMPV